MFGLVIGEGFDACEEQGVLLEQVVQLVGHELLLSPEAEVGVRLLFQSQLLSVHGARKLAPQLLRHQTQLLELNSLQLSESILVFVPLKQVVAVTQFIPQKADLF